MMISTTPALDDMSLAAPPPALPITLTSVDKLQTLVRRLLEARYNGELTIRGASIARICLFEGRVAWLRLTDYPEHLGDLMRRELGVPNAVLRTVIAHCRTTGMRFGEGLVALGVVKPYELRTCLHRHLSDQLWELMMWEGSVEVEHNRSPHRYNHSYTFHLDRLLEHPTMPNELERAQLVELVQRCHEHLPRLSLACVIESEEGTVLYTAGAKDPEAEDLLSLCAAEVRRLAANRIIQDNSDPSSMMLSSKTSCLVMQHLRWRQGWVLVLGGRHPPGLLFAMAASAAGRPSFGVTASREISVHSP